MTHYCGFLVVSPGAKRAWSGSIIAEYDYDGLFRRVRKYVTKQGVEAAPGDGGNTYADRGFRSE